MAARAGSMAAWEIGKSFSDESLFHARARWLLLREGASGPIGRATGVDLNTPPEMSLPELHSSYSAGVPA